MWADILPWEALKNMQKLKSGQKNLQDSKSAKKYPAISWGIFACPIVFPTSKKILTLDE